MNAASVQIKGQKDEPPKGALFLLARYGCNKQQIIVTVARGQLLDSSNTFDLLRHRDGPCSQKFNLIEAQLEQNYEVHQGLY
jgi:hypothetical protein